MLEKNPKTDKTSESRVGRDHSVSTCSVVPPQPSQREIACEVCGHINTGQSLICEMCSNYLFK